MSQDAGKTVLIVDDDEDFRLQEKVQLEAAGYRVLEAADEAAAREVLGAERPDLAILDLMMEDADAGFALSYALKRQYPDVPVILVSGVTHETGLAFDAVTEEERSWVKADAFLAKPVRFEQLLHEMDRLLQSGG